MTNVCWPSAEHNLYGSPDKWMEVNMYHQCFICWDDFAKILEKLFTKRTYLISSPGLLATILLWKPSFIQIHDFFCAKNIV